MKNEWFDSRYQTNLNGSNKPLSFRTTHWIPFLSLLLSIFLQNHAVNGEETNSSDGMSQTEWIFRIGGVVILIMMSGMFSGLTLGLLSLDIIGLEIVIGAGEAENATEEEIRQANAAKKIAPIRANGNLLLTTLLLGNTAVNSFLSILLADLTDGLVGVIVSTAVITTFGEIIPQALCSRYALIIGSRAVPIVKVIICIVYVLAKPISWVLDKVLGEEIGTIHNKNALRKMLEIHVNREAIDAEEGHIMHGAISYKQKEVSSVMTSIDQVFTLPVTAKLSFQTIREIFKSGYSRIPVWGKDMNDIVGLLFVKDLIFIDPEDETPVLNFIHIFGRGVHKVWPDSKLGDVLKMFKMGKGHLALVYDVNNTGPGDPFYELKGLVTLEDIIEEILQDEIVDETDVYVEVEKQNRVSRSFDYGRLRMLDTRILDDTLSSEEVKAVSAHLLANCFAFQRRDNNGKPLTDSAVRALISRCAVVEYGVNSPNGVTIYNRDVSTTNCVVIMQGKVKVSAGREGFVSEVGSWTVLAAECLIASEGAYAPDYSAVVADDGIVRCLRIARVDFQHMMYPLSRPSISHDSASAETNTTTEPVRPSTSNSTTTTESASNVSRTSFSNMQVVPSDDISGVGETNLLMEEHQPVVDDARNALENGRRRNSK